MSYEKQNFQNGQILTAAHLNHIEDGIAAVENASGNTGAGLTNEEKRYMVSLFSQTAYASAGMQKIYDALKTLWGVTEIEPDTPVTPNPDPEEPNPDPEEPDTGTKTILTTKTYDKWNVNTPLATGYNLPFTPKVDMTLKGLRFKLLSSAAATLRVVIYDTVESILQKRQLTLFKAQRTETRSMWLSMLH